jgi:single-stranded DNA-specific DHH superfamily exonuclease
MLTKKQIKEIKTHLNKAQNPVFFFDNDVDGLCSFLLLQRYLGRGKGVAIKSFPELVKDYFRKVHELKADYIFILDKPIVSEEFFKEAEKINIPVIWIDHHIIDRETIPSFVNYYNPLMNKSKSAEPVTALCYQITDKKNDLWMAIAGCIYDSFVPEFYGEFEKKYPDFSIKSKKAPDIYYKSQIGKIARIFSFGLKDRTTNVINMIRFLMKVKTPYEVLEESSKNYTMHHRFRQIESKYRKLLRKATSIGKKQGKMLFFQYGGDLSISGDLSNELSYLFPDKTIVVIYIKGIKANISIRGENSRKILLKAIEGFEDVSGGGHEEAVGGQVRIEDLEKFRENLMKQI